jgi:hypothetical protein
MPAAYNQSIYLMVGVPYLSLTVVGFMIYRGCKLNTAYLNQAHKELRDEEPRTQ